MADLIRKTYTAKLKSKTASFSVERAEQATADGGQLPPSFVFGVDPRTTWTGEELREVIATLDRALQGT